MPRHHIVPKMILRRFASDDEKLQAIPRGGGPVIPMSVETACAEREFYELELELEYQEEFPPNRVEEIFSNFEGRAHPIIDRLTNGAGPEALSVQDRFDLTAFVALQLCRGWAFRDSLVEGVTLRALIETVTPERVRQWLEDQGLLSDEAAVQEVLTIEAQFRTASCAPEGFARSGDVEVRLRTRASTPFF